MELIPESADLMDYLEELDVSIEKEMLAFSIQKEFDEKDFPIIYTKPNRKIISVLEKHTNALEMYKYYLPENL
jgi:hypothetical protein